MQMHKKVTESSTIIKNGSGKVDLSHLDEVFEELINLQTELKKVLSKNPFTKLNRRMKRRR